MAKTRKAGSAANKSARGGLKTEATKARNAPASTEASALPFAHRTPSQLHASTYLPKQG